MGIYVIPDCRLKVFNFSLSSMMRAGGFVTYDLHCVEICSFYIKLEERFYQEIKFNCVGFFSFILWDVCLSFCSCGHQIYRLACVVPSLSLSDKLYLVVVNNSFNILNSVWLKCKGIYVHPRYGRAVLSSSNGLLWF